VLQLDATVDTHTVVPPLKTDPITVGPIATPIEPIDGPTNDSDPGVNGGTWNAGRAGSVGSAGSAGSVGSETAGEVAALASATGAAIASAATTAAAATARVLIQPVRLLVSTGFSYEGPSAPDSAWTMSDDHSARDHSTQFAQIAVLGTFDLGKGPAEATAPRMPGRPVSHRPTDPEHHGVVDGIPQKVAKSGPARLASQVPGRASSGTELLSVRGSLLRIALFTAKSATSHRRGRPRDSKDRSLGQGMDRSPVTSCQEHPPSGHAE
jgi:hypothetical protein